MKVSRATHNYRMSSRLLHFASYNQLHTIHFFLSFLLLAAIVLFYFSLPLANEYIV